MRVIHRISFHSSPIIRKELAVLGIVVGSTGFVAFDFDESQPQWPKVADWMKRRGVSSFVSTSFSEAEIRAAAWLALQPTWHHGYPQPNADVFGYREVTYDLAEYCDVCGIGKKQRAPFQMKSEPRWGRSGILQLNWIFDEYFALPRVWSTIFKPYGIGCRPVTNKRGIELKTVVQLVGAEEEDIVPDGLPVNKCTKCGRPKYLPVTRGPFPALVNRPSAHMVKTRQYFGSGASAHHEVLVSQDIARSLLANKIRGVSLRPVQADEKNSGSRRGHLGSG
jgi:hypothetical protein